MSALANAEGGDLIFGIDAHSGVPKSVVGVRPADPDAEILRLENLLRDGLSPRLTGLTARWITEADLPNVSDEPNSVTAVIGGKLDGSPPPGL